MATRYERLAGVSANYLDGTFASITQQNETVPSVLLIGSASEGLSHIPFAVANVDSVAKEFGASSNVTQLAAQSVNMAANVFVSRVGGKQSHFKITKGIDGSSEEETLVRISPLERGESSKFAELKIVLAPFKDGSFYRQRVVIFDGEAERALFDSEGILSTDESLFEVEINVSGDEILSTKELVDFAAFEAFAETDLDSEITSGVDFDAAASINSYNGISASSLSSLTTRVELTEGNSNSPTTPNELFANLETLHQELEYSALDFVYCEDALLDVKAVASTGYDASSFETWDKKELGYFSRQDLFGKNYMTSFCDADALNSDLHLTAATLSVPNSGEMRVENLADIGLLLSLADVRVNTSASSNVDIFPKDDGRLGVDITFGITGGTLTAETLSTQLFDIVVPASASSLSGTFSDLDISGLFTIKNEDGLNHKKAVLTHFDLTGEVVPEDEYMESLLDLSASPEIKATPASDLVIREVSFAHQAASMAYTASTEYKTTMAVVGVSEPIGGRQSVGRWAGKAPSYGVDKFGDLVVDGNGSGLMSNKLLFGGTDYRKKNSSSWGLAYGGLIMTNYGFGIDDQDELLDANGVAVDIGKHLLVCGAHGIVTTPNVDRSSQRAATTIARKVNLGAKLIERLISMPVNEEPLGPVNGLLPGVTTTRARISRSTINDLAMGRVAVIDETGAIASLRTAALPSSDYTRISTIRAVNEVLSAMRSRCLPFLGKSYSDAQIAALDADLAGVMRALKIEGTIQEGVAEIEATRLDRINGRMTIKVSVIPPLSIEAITIDLKLQAPGA